MSNDLNQCQFIGRLGKDPEVRAMPSGNTVCNFSIACGEQWKDKNSGEKREKTEWVNCVVFGKLAEICGQYLKKGSQVYLQGKMQTDKYQKEGVDHYSTKINVQNMQMLGGKPENQSAANTQWGQPQQPNAQQQNPPTTTAKGGTLAQNMANPPKEPPMDFDDDIPF